MMLLSDLKLTFSGIFRKCLKTHVLQSGKAEKYADFLMAALDKEKSIDIDTDSDKRDPAFSTDYLFSKARGQMFGILICINSKGETVILKAFSGQYNSRWTVPGWVPPVIDPDDFDKTVREKDKEIKKLDREIEKLKSIIKIASGREHTVKTNAEKDIENPSTDISAELIISNSDCSAEANKDAVSEKIKELKEKRKKISQNLMKEIHSLYYLHNFAGEKRQMGTVFKKEESLSADAVPGTTVPAMPADKEEAPSASKEACGTPVPEGTPVPLGANMPSDNMEAPRTDVLGPPVPAMPAGKMEAPSASKEACGTPVPAMPAGTGDCCAPKLLNYAAKEKLIPLSMVEFYYGKENRSGSKIHRHFYPPCTDKCGPIMEYMLTGIKELHKKYSSIIQSAKI